MRINPHYPHADRPDGCQDDGEEEEETGETPLVELIRRACSVLSYVFCVVYSVVATI